MLAHEYSLHDYFLAMAPAPDREAKNNSEVGNEGCERLFLADGVDYNHQLNRSAESIRRALRAAFRWTYLWVLKKA
jgi:hypothetical protein